MLSGTFTYLLKYVFRTKKFCISITTLILNCCKLFNFKLFCVLLLSACKSSDLEEFPIRKHFGIIENIQAWIYHFLKNIWLSA